ncbi:MAG: hypothetical protein GY820_14835 [Gammaproteobacteria bacterium]|nr:hypothetical protein [Gammaproteobacteria bacterium]
MLKNKVQLLSFIAVGIGILSTAVEAVNYKPWRHSYCDSNSDNCGRITVTGQLSGNSHEIETKNLAIWSKNRCKVAPGVTIKKGLVYKFDNTFRSGKKGRWNVTLPLSRAEKRLENQTGVNHRDYDNCKYELRVLMWVRNYGDPRSSTTWRLAKREDVKVRENNTYYQARWKKTGCAADTFLCNHHHHIREFKADWL